MPETDALPLWIQNYQTHEWTVYKMLATDYEAEVAPLLEPLDPRWQVCHSESQMAREELKDNPNRFYTDWELVAADLDPTQGCDIMQLKAPWKNHSASAIVIIGYQGIKDNPPTFSICMEQK